MNKMIERIRVIWHTRFDPKTSVMDDYETLIRLARRCAYDFSHASDYVKVPPHLAEIIDYESRARWWVALFAKGNPGKDYRMRCATNMNEANERLELLLAFFNERAIDLPPELARRIGNGIPF